MAHPNLERFDSVGGVPVHYTRFSGKNRLEYGSIGKPKSTRNTSAFRNKLDASFSELWRKSLLGRAKAVVTAGGYVDKPGYHGKGRAFDIDSIFWPCRTFVTRKYPEYPQLYLAVEAILKKHFGTVLAYYYNRQHRDHFHVSGRPNIGFRKFRSHTLFVQGVCWHIREDRFHRNEKKAIDGVYGRKTREALERACQQWNVPKALDKVDNWNRFLDAAARDGFSKAIVGTTCRISQ